MGPQRCGALSTNAVVTNVNVLQPAVACKVGPQRCGTVITKDIGTDVKVHHRDARACDYTRA